MKFLELGFYQSIFREMVMNKGKKLPVGTIRDWKGKKYIKTGTGWKPHRTGGGEKKTGMLNTGDKVVEGEKLIWHTYTGDGKEKTEIMEVREQLDNKWVQIRRDDGEIFHTTLNRLERAKKEESPKTEKKTKQKKEFDPWASRENQAKYQKKEQARMNKDNITYEDFQKLPYKAVLIDSAFGKDGKKDSLWRVHDKNRNKIGHYDTFDEARNAAVEAAGGDKANVFHYNRDLKGDNKVSPIFEVGLEKLKEHQGKEETPKSENQKLADNINKKAEALMKQNDMKEAGESEKLNNIFPELKDRPKISPEELKDSKKGRLVINSHGEAGHLAISTDPTKDSKDPRSGHTRGYRTKGDQLRVSNEQISKMVSNDLERMEKEGVKFVGKDGTIYNKDDIARFVSTDKIKGTHEIQLVLPNKKESRVDRAGRAFYNAKEGTAEYEAAKKELEDALDEKTGTGKYAKKELAEKTAEPEKKTKHKKLRGATDIMNDLINLKIDPLKALNELYNTGKSEKEVKDIFHRNMEIRRKVIKEKKEKEAKIAEEAKPYEIYEENDRYWYKDERGKRYSHDTKEMAEEYLKKEEKKTGKGWQNPLAKYKDVSPVIVARTIRDAKNIERVKTPEGKKLLIDILTTKNGVSKEDATDFVEKLARTTDKERKIADKYVKEMESKGIFKSLAGKKKKMILRMKKGSL